MKNIWNCKIGEEFPYELPAGADLPMRNAVREAYFRITGVEPDFIFPGWGGELTDTEREAHESLERIKNA